VDVAAQAGREVLSDGHSSRNFGSPVLWMRLRNGRLFATKESEKGEESPLDSLKVTTRSKYLIPFRDDIPIEYVGNREEYYEGYLERRRVVSIWGKPGVGKTWVGVNLAIKLKEAEPQRQVFWFECTEDMDFNKLASEIADCLSQQGEDLLRQFLCGRGKEQAAPAPDVIDLLVGLLNRRQYLLCFDDFHYVSGDPNIRSLLRKLVEKLRATSTKVILIGQRKPSVARIGGRELRGMTRTEVQSLLLALRERDKEWLDETAAGKFADRLMELVGVNLTLMNIVAMEWLESHTTRKQAEDYLDRLDVAEIAKLILEREDKAQNTLLTILSILKDWEDRFTLIELAQKMVNKGKLDQAISTLVRVKLVEENEERYRLPKSVRKVCRERQREQQEDLSGLHRHVADIHSKKGRILSAVDHYLKAKAFSEAIKLLADNMLVITRAGGGEKALRQLERIEGATFSRRDGLWVRILKGDLEAWLGRLEAAQRSVEIGLQGLARIPESERPAYKYEEGRLKARLGTILGSKRELEKMMQYLDESKTLMQEYMWEKGIKGQASRVPALLMVFNNLGIAHCVLANELEGPDRASNFKKAIRSFEECINTGEAFKGIPHVDYIIPWALVNLSQVYDDRGEENDREKALKKAHQGLKKFQEIGHQWGIGFANSTLGTIYLRLGDYEKAAKHHQRGLKAAHKCADIEGIISSSVTLAEINIIKREWPAVDKYLEAAKEALDKVQMSDLAEYVSYFERWAKGVNLLQKGQTDEGERILHDVLEYFRGSSEDYYEALCVERDLREFNCSVPEIEAQVPPPDSMPAPVEAPALVLSPSALVEASTSGDQILPAPAEAPAPASSPPVQAETSAPGGQIGRYEIEAELGRGARGIVYKAYDPNIGRFVALKVLQVTPGPYAEEWEQHFRREARAAGKLRHPNIVTVYDADAISGQWYIAMEYLEGKTLAEIIRQEGAQSLEWVTDIVTQTCDALNYAHEHRVIHRDIKPSNIMVLEDGQGDRFWLGQYWVAFLDN
ncbi:MAG TPA: NACHT domain-containing protein, partial [Phycisphaerales bacterium]|nr:NACHT domain-containing protein [Phycisphaerales bacterium]